LENTTPVIGIGKQRYHQSGIYLVVLLRTTMEKINKQLNKLSLFIFLIIIGLITALFLLLNAFL
jgi:hypothetical protein